MKNIKKLREEYGAGQEGTDELKKKYTAETPGQQLEATDYSGVAKSASDKASESPSSLNHRAASDAHDAAAGWHEKKAKKLMDSGASSEEVSKHETAAKTHKNAAQTHRFKAFRMRGQQQNEETTVTEAKWKVTFVHKHPGGDKKHDYVVSAPHQNAADKKAIEMHRKENPTGNFHMWNSEELYEEGLKDACWKGYEAIGTKMKNGKRVPNCVPKEEAEKNNSEPVETCEDKVSEAVEKKPYDPETPLNKHVQSQIHRDYLGYKAMDTKDILKHHKARYRVTSNYSAADAGGKQGMISGLLRHKHGDRHVDHYFGLKEATEGPKIKVSTTQPIGHRIADIGPGGKEHNVVTKNWPGEKDNKNGTKSPSVKESADDINLRITKHVAAAAKAGRAGDRQAQEWHLAKIANLKRELGENLDEAAKKGDVQKHIVTVTVSDPHHPMITQRKATVMKRVKVTAADTKEAEAKATAHYKKHGFKVHDAFHHSMVNEAADPGSDDGVEEIGMAKAQLNQICDMADELADSMDDMDELEAWAQDKISSAYDDLNEIYTYIVYGEGTDDEEQDYPDSDDSEEDDEEKKEIVKEQSDAEDSATIGADSIKRIQQLIRLGLLDQAEMPMIVRAMKRLNVGDVVASPAERAALYDLLEKLIGIITGDDMIFAKVRSGISRGTIGEGSISGNASAGRKSELKKYFRRGALGWHEPKQKGSPEHRAFMAGKAAASTKDKLTSK
jgi:hypothetical protein